MRYVDSLSLLSFALTLCAVTDAQSHGPYESLDDLWSGELINASTKMPSRAEGLRGRQKFGQCCYLAVSQALEIKDGELAFRERQTVFRGEASSLERYQMPCDAVYDGKGADQPQIWVSYSWCSSNCPGWAVARPDEIGAWVKPLTAFILPSIVFVLNVPRRRRLNVPKQLFPRLSGPFVGKLGLLFKVPAASLIILLDTFIWLAVVLCMAGPMLFSGIHEALLDFRLLSFLELRYKSNSLSVKERAHLLLIILLGNLDQNPSWEHSKAVVAALPHDSLRRRHSSLSSNPAYSMSDTTMMGPYPSFAAAAITSVKQRLASMLESQTSFGAAVGAAVLFYTGSFVYTIVELRGEWGKGQHAHHIAFGIFWMTVPQVAIVGSLLLGGNNPSAWEGIVAEPVVAAGRGMFRSSIMRQSSHQMLSNIATRPGRDGGRSLSQDTAFSPDSTKKTANAASAESSFASPGRSWKGILDAYLHILAKIYRPMYKTAYKPAWMWNRGVSKAAWVRRLIGEYPKLVGLEDEVLHMGLGGWLTYTLIPTLTLLLLPPFLGGVVSFTTPVTGLSCRSMNFLVWASSQALLVVLWFVNWRWFEKEGERKTNPVTKNRRRPLHWLWYILFILSVMAAIFSSIGGTMFVLMQLYRNCLCWLPVCNQARLIVKAMRHRRSSISNAYNAQIRYWWNRHTDPAAQMYLAEGSSEQIYYAKKFWLPTGLAAIGLLLANAYIGWWYSRRLRAQFHSLVRRLESVNARDIRENEDIMETEEAVEERKDSSGGDDTIKRGDEVGEFA